MQQMKTRRPYLIRALYEWIIDNGLTPYIVADASCEGVEVPQQFVVDGEIVLNINPTAVRNLQLGQEYIMFDARFSGKARSIVVPVHAVYAIYAQENGEGMVFGSRHRPDDELPGDREVPAPQDDRLSPLKPSSTRPSLKVIK